MLLHNEEKFEKSAKLAQSFWNYFKIKHWGLIIRLISLKSEISLLDNAHNNLVGCVIQKRYPVHCVCSEHVMYKL